MIPITYTRPSVHLTVLGLLEIATGLVKVVTLGSVLTNWEMSFLYWFSIRRMKKNGSS